MVDNVLVSSVCSCFFVENLGQFSPLLWILIPIMLDHYLVFQFSEVIFRGLVIVYKESLTWLPLEVRIDELSSLSLIRG
jgi:hypothetical protein